ncbi:MAG: aldo/keto reductase [Parvibaculum sp.]|uniref:aldo/keto reductase n=1 Tax=Parvibaculum sp. TaxID=2024848 RepID=UPI0034A06A02
MPKTSPKMSYIRLGASGLRVSRLCLGTMTYGSKKWRDWILEEKEARPFFEKAFDAGINFFDTADVYSGGVSEEIVGRAIRDLAKDREDVVIATKCFFGTGARGPNRSGLSRKSVMAACDASLRRLGLDYIDLYQIHRFDPNVPMEETLEALNDLVRAGKVRYIGASSMHGWQFQKYLALSEKLGFARFVSMQNHYNLVYREEEREMMPLCAAEGIGVIPWSPQARGFLAGNRHRQGGGDTARARSDEQAAGWYYDDSDFAVADRNVEIAKKLGVGPAQTALAWVLANPVVTAPIVGISKLAQFDEALTALDITLSPEDKAALEAPYLPHKVLGHL